MPEVRLIDVTIALEEIDKKIKKHDVRWLQDICERNGLIIARKILEKVPTIEAEPVRHGLWDYGECTNCKRNLLELCCGDDCELSRHAEFDAVFCPFCGAKMDGGADNG